MTLVSDSFVENDFCTDLFRLTEDWKRCLEKLRSWNSITELSKAFDFLPRELLMAKLEIQGLDISALQLVYSYWETD